MYMCTIRILGVSTLLVLVGPLVLAGRASNLCHVPFTFTNWPGLLPAPTGISLGDGPPMPGSLPSGGNVKFANML